MSEDKEQSSGKEEHHQDNGESHESHHAAMVRDFKRRFFVSVALTVPLALLSPMLRSLVGMEEAFRLPGHL
ncbi:MAG: hypothetical protein V2I35_07125, partial [Desulfocapsaceae bacterium]|nr:hypothetical protein [Desulfocapsaceae bacterium]